MSSIDKGMEKEKNKESPLSINSMKIQNEMNLLKNDILKDLKNFEKNYSEKFKFSNKLIDEKLEDYEKRIEAYNQKLFQISQNVVEDKSLKEKVEKLSKDKIEIKDQILSMEIKYDKLEKEYNEKINSLESILNSSVIYTGIIGKNSRFINFHEFIDYSLSQISKLIMATQKHTSDIKTLKSKMESNIQNLRTQTDGMVKAANQLTKNLVFESENKTKEIINSLENDLKKLNEENIDFKNKLETINIDIRNDLKKEIESIKIQFEKENKEVIDKIINDFENKENDIKNSYEKLNEELKNINNRINMNEEMQKKENNKIILNNDKKNYNHEDEDEIINKYLRGEINENQFLIYKEFMKLNNTIKNIINDIFDKNSNLNKNIKISTSKKNKSSLTNNFASYLSPYLNNIISEISKERLKRRTVNNLLNCINLKLEEQKKDKKEINNYSLNMRKNYSSNAFQSFDLNDELKIKTSENFNFAKNDLGYKTFQMNNKKYNFRIINSENSKNSINEISKKNEDNINEKIEILNDKNNFNEIKTNYENDNIIINYEKNIQNSNEIKEKIFINKPNKIKKEIINNILQNSEDNKKILRRKTFKDNIMNKFQNNTLKEDESKKIKIFKNTLSAKRESENKIDNQTNMIPYKPFKGKKYFGYEKSLDAKVKEKLIYNDLDYKEKIKRNKDSDICFAQNDSIIFSKPKKNIEVNNIQKMVNNLQSYLNENSNKNKYFLKRNNIYNVSQSAIKSKDYFFNENLFS